MTEEKVTRPQLNRQFSIGSVSTHVSESCVLHHPVSKVWPLIRHLDFSWWSLINTCHQIEGESASTVGSLFQFRFKDGMEWIVQLVELSDINRRITFDVITSKPPLPVSSMIHTISLKRVTSSNETFLEWTTDFSADANTEIVSDSRFKKIDAFNDLAGCLHHKPVVLILGATGHIGSSTVSALSKQFSESIDIRAGVRNPNSPKSQNLALLNGVTVVNADASDGEGLRDALIGVDTLFINTPGHHERAKIVANAANVAKEVGINHIIVVSVPTAQLEDSIFGGEFHKIENQIQNLGLPFTIVRLPLFIENNFGHAPSIKSNSTIFGPSDPNAPFRVIGVGDAGKAISIICRNPGEHRNRTYTLVSSPITQNDIAAAFSAALGRDIEYIQVPYSAAKDSFISAGYPEWQIDGILELYHMIDDGVSEANPTTNHMFEITGDEPTTIEEWCFATRAAFL